MKILVKLNILDRAKIQFLENENEVFYLNKTMSFFSLFFKILNLKKEKDIQIVILEKKQFNLYIYIYI